MSTKIELTYNKKTYILEYSRQSVRTMEQQGFVLDKIGDMPMTMVPLLVYGAFAKHHKDVKRKLMDEIYDHIRDTDGEEGFLRTLLEMYSDTVNTITAGASDIDEGNEATWKVMKG